MNECEVELVKSMHEMVGVMQAQSDCFFENMYKIIDALERLELRMIMLGNRLEELAKMGGKE